MCVCVHVCVVCVCVFCVCVCGRVGGWVCLCVRLGRIIPVLSPIILLFNFLELPIIPVTWSRDTRLTMSSMDTLTRG